MTENEILTRLLKTKDPNFAKSVLRGSVAGASDRAKMEAWLVVVERLGAQAARQYLPTEQMISAYQTATGKNPLAGLDESIKRAIIEPLVEQYGQDVAKRMLGLGQSTPPAAEPEKTEGSYADYVSGETKTETTPTPEATVPTVDGEEAAKQAAAQAALELVNDPTYPDFAKMLEWRNLATKYGKAFANSVFVPTAEMAQSYENEFNKNPWEGFEYGDTDPVTGVQYTPDNPDGERREDDENTEGGYSNYVGGNHVGSIEDNSKPLQVGGTVGIVGGHLVTGSEASLDDLVESSSGDATNVQDPVKESAINGAATDVVDGKIEAPSGANDPGVTDGEGDGTGNGVTPDVPYDETPKSTGSPTPPEEPTGTPTETPTVPEDDTGTPTETPTVPEDETGGDDDTGGGMPTVPEDETGGDDDTGDEFDEKLKKNEEIGNLNIREGAMTYEEWMRAADIDTQRDFNAAAKAAAKEHDRSIGTYGATAEAMGRAGLSGSGYSDYLTGNAYAARQGSMDTARQTKTLADDASRQGYMNYLQDYEDGQRGNIAAAIGELSAMGLTGDKAKQYLSMMGIDSGYADYVVGIVDEMAAEGDPDKQALLAEILNNDLSGDAAMSYAKFLGFDDATAAEVIGMADQLMVGQKEKENAAKKDSILDYFVTNFANLNLTGALAYGQYHGLDEATVKDLYKTAEAITAGAVESNSKAKVQAAYNYIIQTGMTGDIAKEWAMQLGDLDEVEVNELVKLTDKIIASYGASTEGAKEAAEVVVDIGYTELKQLSRITDIIFNPTTTIINGGHLDYTDEELLKLSEEERNFVKLLGPELKAAVTKPDGTYMTGVERTEAWLDALSEFITQYYGSQGYVGSQIEKIVDLIGLTEKSREFYQNKEKGETA